MKYLGIFLVLFLSSTSLIAQFNDKKIDGEATKVNQIKSVFLSGIVEENEDVQNEFEYSNYDLQKRQLTLSSYLEAKGRPQVLHSSDWGIPSWIKGKATGLAARQFQNPEEAAVAYLQANADILPIADAEVDLKAEQTRVDDQLNMVHVKLQQYASDIKIFGGEVWVHLKDDQPVSMTGRLYPLDKVQPAHHLTEDEVYELVQTHFEDSWQSQPQGIEGYTIEQYKAGLQWYPESSSKTLRLTYVIDVYPDYLHRHFIVLDAVTGEILTTYLNMCYLHAHHNDQHSKVDNFTTIKNQPKSSSFSSKPALAGDELANGSDLFGINRDFHVINEGGTYYMVDISRAMYNPGASSLPSNPVGALRTLDGLNNPFLGSINYAHVTSGNNTWTDPAAVSAHYNAGQAYDYFLATYGRNSINGSGSTITSFIHVTNENDQPMDNAFWNGEAMFYGDGNVGFFSLARGLDVAGHEISHGVVQNTANLVYENEPGALNESFADIFGSMIDRDDWLIGEDVVRTSQFPSGALRSMQDPTQGFNSLNDPGYQPGHYTDRYTGSQDRGGVHINSGIPNRAFYLFATAIGKNKAEQVYYNALSNYLTRSSDFQDCRAAVMQSATDLYGTTERDAAATAFSQVGIGSSGTGVPGDDLELQPNPGDDLIAFINENDENPWIVDESLNIIANPLATQTPISKPAISDNGSRIVFINDQNNIYFVSIDWSVPVITDSRELTTDSDWRNVTISKDGLLLAAVNQNPENTITIFELSTGNGQTYPLTNPTTGGVATGDVLYSDAMEFDYSGRYLLYDAVNEITGNNENIQYWDIGILRAWNRQANDFGDGVITKLFTGLPEGISIGNPTLSKTRPNVLAYDLIEEGFFSNEYYLFASNIETNTTAEIFHNTKVSYPSYSRDDSKIVFNAENYSYDVVGQIDLLDDRITPTGNATIFLNGGYWATWFSNGTRNINVGIGSDPISEAIDISPNPANEYLNVHLGDESGKVEYLRLFDMNGKIMTELNENVETNSYKLSLKHLPSGQYILEIKTATGSGRKSFIIQH